MRIAVCDDDQREREGLCSLLEQAGQRYGRIDLLSFSNALDLLHAAEANRDLDVVIFDIMMPGLNGIDAARELRAHNEAVNIVFLTSTPEFAVDSYEVHASNYLIKPVEPAKLFDTLDRIKQTLDKPREVLTLDKPHRLVTIPFDQIEYVEIVGKTLHFMLLNNGEESIKAPLRDYEEKLLDRPGFFKTHRSFIVNFTNMRELNSDTFISMSKRNVPIARGLRKEAKDAFVRFLFEDADRR